MMATTPKGKQQAMETATAHNMWEAGLGGRPSAGASTGANEATLRTL